MNKKTAKPSHSKRKGFSNTSNIYYSITQKSEEYKQLFQGLSKYGVTFQEVEQRYFIVYLNLEKFLTVDLNHQNKQATYCCFEKYFDDLLDGLIAENYSEDDILPILINTILMRRKVVNHPIVKTTLPMLYLRSIKNLN